MPWFCQKNVAIKDMNTRLVSIVECFLLLELFTPAGDIILHHTDCLKTSRIPTTDHDKPFWEFTRLNYGIEGKHDEWKWRLQLEHEPQGGQVTRGAEFYRRWWLCLDSNTRSYKDTRVYVQIMQNFPMLHTLTPCYTNAVLIHFTAIHPLEGSIIIVLYSLWEHKRLLYYRPEWPLCPKKWL